MLLTQANINMLLGMVKADINFRREDYQGKHKLCDDCQIFLVPVDDRNAGTKFQVSEVKHRETTIFSVMKECNIKRPG